MERNYLREISDGLADGSLIAYQDDSYGDGETYYIAKDTNIDEQREMLSKRRKHCKEEIDCKYITSSYLCTLNYKEVCVFDDNIQKGE